MNLSNRIRDDLDKEGHTTGTWLTLASPMAAEVLAMAGFRWLCIDAEHSPIGLNEICHMIRAIESRGATPIVRVPEDNLVMIGRVLDAGAMGIVVPHVRSSEQAQKIARACRYAPAGSRSVGTGRGFTWGRSYGAEIDRLVTVIAQIEDQEGVDCAEQIVRTEGIDIGMLGTKDLAYSMGVSQGSKEHEEAISHFLDACQCAGIPAGIPVKSREELIDRRNQGFKFFALTNDFRLLEQAALRELRPEGN